MTKDKFQIRDPIHGVIFIDRRERAVIESRAFQRLRNIKQVGFLDFAFPAASHSRYCHSLGAMSFASIIFDRVVDMDEVSEPHRSMMRTAVRLAALLHDIGHPPLSHTTEMILPAINGRPQTHEDFTKKIIMDSELTGVIKDNFGDFHITPAMVASLLSEDYACEHFIINGLNYAPLLQQIISSEIDCDRMDYLLRDSLFCGVNYGKFDSDWLIENLLSVKKHNQVFLGFKARALFAFEDFLLSRYHMFASVYLHHTPVIMEKMLERFFAESPEHFSLPADIEQYIEINDIDLWSALRKSPNRWAQRIVSRRPFVKIYEHIHRSNNDINNVDNVALIKDVCRENNIEIISTRSKSVLSKYFNTAKNPLYVEDENNRAILLEEYSSLFIKYQAPTELVRIYVAPEQKTIIKELLAMRM